MDYKEIRKIVEKDPEIKALKIDDFELMTAYRYLKMKNENEDPNFIPSLKRIDDLLEIILVPTEEFDLELKRQNHQSNIGTLDTTRYVFDASLADFVLNTEERKEVYLKASRFIDLVKENKSTKGLYLHGRYGTGKTYLLSAIVDEISKYKKVLFVYFPDLVRNLKSSISSNELEDKVIALKTCDVLVFDDMGSENMTEWFRDEIVAPILQFRLASSLPILISSNHDQKQLLVYLSEGKQEMDRAKGARIAHRIKELTEEVPLTIEFGK